MPQAAPRIDVRLVAALVRLDRGRPPIADSHRRVGTVAEQLSLPRPSYEQIRVLVHLLRRGGGAPDYGGLLLDIALQARPPEALLDALAR
jgi:hypothetical protein